MEPMAVKIDRDQIITFEKFADVPLRAGDLVEVIFGRRNGKIEPRVLLVNDEPRVELFEEEAEPGFVINLGEAPQ